MKNRWVFLSALLAGGAQAEPVKSVVTASNGVEVTVYSDDFANRYEYSSPLVKAADGFIMVGTVKKSGSAPFPNIIGSFIYSGEWRKYNSAIYKGGDMADFKVSGRNVGRCSSSRYSSPSCTLTESFNVKISEPDVKNHTQNGILAFQVRAEDTSTVIFNVPISYIDAVKEIADRPISN